MLREARAVMAKLPTTLCPPSPTTTPAAAEEMDERGATTQRVRKTSRERGERESFLFRDVGGSHRGRDRQRSTHRAQSSGQARRFAPMETCPERDKLDRHDHAMIGQTHPPLFTQNTVVSHRTANTAGFDTG